MCIIDNIASVLRCMTCWQSGLKDKPVAYERIVTVCRFLQAHIELLAETYQIDQINRTVHFILDFVEVYKYLLEVEKKTVPYAVSWDALQLAIFITNSYIKSYDLLKLSANTFNLFIMSL